LDFIENYLKLDFTNDEYSTSKMLPITTLNDNNDKNDNNDNTNNRSGRVGYLKIEVIDSGCGISKKELTNLFKRFSQIGSNSHKQLGTGLGLWISQNLCHKMNGDLKVFSTENEGTTFVATIKCEIAKDDD